MWAERYMCQLNYGWGALQKSVQYVGGKVYGIKDDQVTKTLLCVMVKSVASEYRDVIAMVEVSKIGSNVLHNIWTNVIGTLTEIGFDVAAIITDGHSSNTNFFKEMLKREITMQL